MLPRTSSGGMPLPRSFGPLPAGRALPSDPRIWYGHGRGPGVSARRSKRRILKKKGAVPGMSSEAQHVDMAVGTVRPSRRADRAGLSAEIRELLQHRDGSGMTYEAILQALPRGSHSLLLIILSFPLCFPVGIPVLTTTLGLILAMVGLFLFLGRAPWLPRVLRRRVVPYDRLEHITRRLLRVTLAAERLLHPRLLALVDNGHAVRIHGLYVMALALIAAIPIPLPLGNLVAAFPILLMGLGLAERDGIFILASYLAGLPCAIYYAGVGILGFEGIQQLLGP